MSSVAPVHPAKAVERNEMPFGRDTLVFLSNIVLNRGPVRQRREDLGGVGTPVRSDAYHCQITLAGLCSILVFRSRQRQRLLL